MLGRFIPEFGRIVAQMQYNMYHVYTVDEHTHPRDRRARRHRAAAARRRACRCRPRSCRCSRDRELCSLAMLLHDIGKGGGGDHEKVGAAIAQAPVRGSASSAEQIELVAWLVEHHLVMSDFASEARHRRPADRRRLRRHRAVAGAAAPAAGADRRRHPRGRARTSGTAGRASCCASSTTRPRRRWRAATAGQARDGASSVAKERLGEALASWPEPWTQAAIEAYRGPPRSVATGSASRRGAPAPCPPDRGQADDSAAPLALDFRVDEFRARDRARCSTPPTIRACS